MDLRHLAVTEASAFADRLIAACEAAVQQARSEAEQTVEKAREETRRVARSLDEESARKGLLEQAHAQAVRDYTARLAEADAAQATLRSEAHAMEAALLRDAQAREAVLQSELQAAEAARAEAVWEAEADGRNAAQAAEAAIRHESQVTRLALLDELARAATAVQTLREELRAAQQRELQQAEQVRQLETGLHDANRAATAVGQQAYDLEARLRDAAATSADLRQQVHVLDARVKDADASAAGLRRQAQDAEEAVAAVLGELVNSTGAATRTATLLAASVDAIDALAAPAKVEEVLRTLVEQLGRQFERTAIFRVRGKHLQGAHGTGIDLTLDVTKLMIPVSMDSVMTRALVSGAAACLQGEQLAEVRPPFGGTPAAALAIPIVFGRDTLAVLYADSRAGLTEAHLVFATLVARHTTAVLARLAQELKTARELREYAQSLLEEAEQLFVADVEAGRPGPERLQRLRSSLEFTRQLFDQRTALEPVPMPGLLDQQIAAVVAAEPGRPFSRELALAIDQAESRRASAS